VSVREPWEAGTETFRDALIPLLKAVWRTSWENRAGHRFRLPHVVPFFRVASFFYLLDTTHICGKGKAGNSEHLLSVNVPGSPVNMLGKGAWLNATNMSFIVLGEIVTFFCSGDPSLFLSS
jgi:hypothetical protein